VFNHFARLSADQQLAVVIELPTRLEEDRLRDAVASLVRQQPVLGCRLSCEKATPRFTQVDSAAALSVSQVHDGWAAALDAAAQPLDFSEGGVLRVGLFQGTNSDALALRIDHAAADGQGAKQIAALLADLYTSAHGAPRDLAGTSTPDRSAKRLLHRFSLAEKISLMRSRESIRPAWGFPVAGGDPGRRGHVVSTMTAQDFSAAREKAKGVGATVNDVLLAAFYRALFTELAPTEGQRMAINVSFDMRRYLDADHEMPAASNLSSTETALLARVLDEPFAETLGRAVAVMTRLKTGRPGLSSVVLLEYARILGYRTVERMVVEPMRRGREHGVSFPFLSNFGVLEADRLVFNDAAPKRAVVLPPVGHPPFVMLGPSSYAGELSLAMGYAEGETDPALVERVVDGMVADIVTWSA
jgi:NRPS condensation-like uncharacterized protein